MLPEVTVAIIPVKGALAGKSRLAPVLGPAARSRLVLWMLGRVALAARQAGLDVHVVGGDPPVVELCAEFGCTWSKDRGGLNPSVKAALDEATARGWQAALVLPGDVPWVRPGDISAVLGVLKNPSTIALVPSPDGGTNALALALPARLEPAFGPASFWRHRTLARRAGLRAVALRPAGLARDVDVPVDLTADLYRAISEAATPGR